MTISSNTMQAGEWNDAQLVAESLGGSRDAFRLIVGRYQTLICSLAYSATGNLSQSEDLAQETFITAWSRLASLREPEKLRPWLCGILRHCAQRSFRDGTREPARNAAPLDVAEETPALEASPQEQTISREEESILWRSLEKIPDAYREPLVLFYREHQSVQAVAASLELSEDAVKQRLSRGRKLLQEQVAAFVEGALERTNPGAAFTFAVWSALPAVKIPAAATVGTATAKAGSMVKAGGTIGMLASVLNPVALLFGNFIPYRMAMDGAASSEERRRIKSVFGGAFALALGISTILAGVVFLRFREPNGARVGGLELFQLWFFGAVIAYALSLICFGMATASMRRRHLAETLARENGGVMPRPHFEYRSKAKLLGMPLIHIRIGDRFDILRKPVVAWIAMGNHAIGGLIAFGAVAVAPFSVGGLAFGLLPFGGLVIGLMPMGAVAIGMWAFGGIAIGCEAYGMFAAGWSMANGSIALARDVAVGHFAHAKEANNEFAKFFVESDQFFRVMTFLNRHWLWTYFVWVTPLLLQWRVIRKSKMAKAAQG